MTLFVAGVHAVGKTIVLKPVCESLGVRHASASQLIKEQRGLQNWTTSRQVGAIDENQRALVDAVQRLKRDGETVILDGHFVLRRAVGIHEKISVRTFSQLMIRGAIVMEAATTTIADRLLQRGDATWDRAEIDIFAQRELEHAEFVCRHLEIPLIRLCSPSAVEVRETVARLLA
uniref:ATP-binding protein n=1 Tax=Cupriavidus taiwanensis TaxID=164546 RepID=UPI000E202613|nr:ATP-binding protein [Cupriavidus taiwanensis]